MSQSLLLSQSRLSLPVHHVTWDTWTASHARSLAWLFSACLVQILLLFKVLDLNTYKPHRYTSQLRQHKSQHSNYTHAHSCSFLYFTLVSWRGLLGLSPFVGHTYTNNLAWIHVVAQVLAFLRVNMLTCTQPEERGIFPKGRNPTNPGGEGGLGTERKSLRSPVCRRILSHISEGFQKLI
jgi:uncharacterized membrane protein